MDRLWAPWRVNYIRSKKQKGCIFCLKERKGAKDYILFRTRHSTAMLNIYPYNAGHILVAPNRHIKDIGALSDSEALDLFQAVKKAKRLLNKVLKPHGYNIGINLSASAGAGITGHLHIHIVPRWKGDTNFMSTVFNSRVISDSLDELHKQLKNA